MDIYIPKIKAYLRGNSCNKSINFSDQTSVTFLAQGEYNKNYLIEDQGEKYVFRINMGSQLNLDNQIEYEFNAIKRLEKSGVTPIGYFCDNSRKYFDEGVLLMNYLNGRPLDYKTDLEKAARIFAGIHQLETCAFENILIKEEDLCIARVKEADQWLEAFRKSTLPVDEVKDVIESLYKYCLMNAEETDQYFKNEPWMVVNNTEVNSHNFIIGEDKSFLIDWEKPVISDPVQDITQFLAPTTTLWKTETVLSNGEINHFYDIYESLVGREVRERVKAYEPFLFLRAFSWCAGAWITYMDESKKIKNPQTFEVIKKYLDVNFMRDILKEYV